MKSESGLRSGLRRSYFIAGGGTGGHIYPGLAIAKALREIDPLAEVYFVGTEEGLEKELVPAAGYKLFLIPGGKLNFAGRWLLKIKTLIRMPLAFVRSAQLLLQNPPQAVLGVGGYASGPFVMTASLLGFRTALWEPNAFPGLTNRLLARFVHVCYLVFGETEKQIKARKIQRLGMPVRAEVEVGHQEIKTNGKKTEIETEPFRILCFGGSQGARAVNEALAACLLKLGEDQRHLQGRKIEVVHQIGSTDWAKFQEKYKNMGPWLRPMEFIRDMPERYRWADLVIARAGASTVSEIAAFGKPAILIPLPGAEAHQEFNAESMAAKNAVVLLKQKDLTPDRLWSEIESLKNNPERRREMSSKVIHFFEPEAARKIAQSL
ncbi:MAG: undecaprenyldiphospho-muramoylpentapeptide beta-N-acetylglucosaminyltransferase, partial [Bdellovibrio sp. SCN 50-8]